MTEVLRSNQAAGGGLRELANEIEMAAAITECDPHLYLPDKTKLWLSAR